MPEPTYRLTQVVGDDEVRMLKKLLANAFNSLENMSARWVEMFEGREITQSEVDEMVSIAHDDADAIARVLGYKERRDR